jgi:hypothetical protein
MPKWWEMDEDLLAQGTIPVVVESPERVKNWYYTHGGTINLEYGTLDYPPSLRETALEMLKKLKMSERVECRLIERSMSSLWRSRILNT